MTSSSKTISFFVIYNAVSRYFLDDPGLSGGDRILIELTKRWRHVFKTYEILTCSSGQRIIKNYIPDTTPIKIHTIQTSPNLYYNLIGLYSYKTYKALTFIHNHRFPEKTYIFTSSDFLTDVLPAWYAKWKNKKIHWVAAFYFFASSPFSKNFPYKGFRQRIRGALYYYTQKIAYFLIRRSADFVVLCNEIDRKIFIRDGFPADRIYPIYGGVDLAEAKAASAPSEPVYDAVFMARFHAQKGPLEVVKAWEEVMQSNPKAQLAMIGNGPLKEKVQQYITNHRLDKNIKLLGFMDGVEKYTVLKSARVFIHSAVYETGGMAAAEGMAAGLPVIAYDHEGFDYCYPRGMVRVAPIGDTKRLGETILQLLKDEKKYQKIRKEAIDFVQEWDWKKRAYTLLKEIKI